MNYAVPSGFLSEGQVTDNHLTRLQQQLSRLANGEFTVGNLSATILQSKNVEKPIVRRQSDVSLILQLTGFIQARGGCFKQCLAKNLNNFKQNLCAMRPSLYV